MIIIGACCILLISERHNYFLEMCNVLLIEREESCQNLDFRFQQRQSNPQPGNGKHKMLQIVLITRKM